MNYEINRSDSSHVDHASGVKTRDLITQIAFRMVTEGRTPVQKQISDEIFQTHGVRVSPNLLSDQMKDFWTNLGPRISSRFALPDIPTDVNEAFLDFWSKCNESAKSEANSALSGLHSKIDALELQLSSQREEIQYKADEIAKILKERESLISQLDSKSSHCEDLQSLLKKSNQDLLDLKQSMSDEMLYWKQRLQESEDKRVAEVREIASSYKDEISRIVETHKLNQEQWDGLKKFLMVQTYDLRESLKTREDFFKKQSEENELKFNQLKIEFSQASDRALREIGRAEAMKEELNRARAELDELRKSKGSDCPAPWDIWVLRAQKLNLPPNIIDMARDFLREHISFVIANKPSELGKWILWSERMLDFCHRLPKQAEPLLQSLLDSEVLPEEYFHDDPLSENVNDTDQD